MICGESFIQSGDAFACRAPGCACGSSGMPAKSLPEREGRAWVMQELEALDEPLRQMVKDRLNSRLNGIHSN